jgi:hypothetical protein
MSLLFAMAVGCSAPAEPAAAVCHSQDAPVRVGSSVAICPVVVSFVIAPNVATVGAEVRIMATAVDPDTEDISFSWKASTGAVADPRAPSTSYRCSAPGRVTVELTVSDGTCQDQESGQIDCRSLP